MSVGAIGGPAWDERSQGRVEPLDGICPLLPSFSQDNRETYTIITQHGNAGGQLYAEGPQSASDFQPAAFVTAATNVVGNYIA